MRWTECNMHGRAEEMYTSFQSENLEIDSHQKHLSRTSFYLKYGSLAEACSCIHHLRAVK